LLQVLTFKQLSIEDKKEFIVLAVCLQQVMSQTGDVTRSSNSVSEHRQRFAPNSGFLACILITLYIEFVNNKGNHGGFGFLG